VVKSKENVPRVEERVFRTWMAAEVMSTPMPSPGMQAMRWMVGPTEWMWDGIVMLVVILMIMVVGRNVDYNVILMWSGIVAYHINYDAYQQ
jgi:hypothetical protein